MPKSSSSSDNNHHEAVGAIKKNEFLISFLFRLPRRVPPRAVYTNHHFRPTDRREKSSRVNGMPLCKPGSYPTLPPSRRG
jgi:hypothetical protein